MAKKDVMDYYKQLHEDYIEMVDNLHVMEKQLEDQLISPERFDYFKEQFDIIKSNYFRVSYIMYLWNRPGKLRSLFMKLFKKEPKWNGPVGSTIEDLKKEDLEALKNTKI